MSSDDTVYPTYTVVHHDGISEPWREERPCIPFTEEDATWVANMHAHAAENEQFGEEARKSFRIIADNVRTHGAAWLNRSIPGPHNKVATSKKET